MNLFRKREWQRLLIAVVMLLSFASLARAGANLVVVNAGYGHYEGTTSEVDDVVRHLTGDETNDNNRCWVDVRNIGDADISRNGTDGNATDKLGIQFVADGKSSWNDMGKWSVPKGKTVRFYSNGGTDGQVYLFKSLNANTSYEMTIEIGQGTNLGITQRKNTVSITVNSDKSGAEFGTNDFWVEGVLIPGDNIYLEKDKKYTFKDRTIVDKWSEANGKSDKVYTFGWFATDGTFNGVSGYYDITSPTDNGRSYNGSYYDIIPVADASKGKDKPAERYKHLNYSGENLNTNDYGALYLGGSKNGFGIPTFDKTFGWDAGNGDTNKDIKGSAIPQITPGVFTFKVTIGDQVNENEPLMFKIYHYKQWELDKDGDNEGTNCEFRNPLSTNDDTFSWNGTKHYTFYHIEKNNATLSPMGGIFQITGTQGKALGNGNIYTEDVGMDSDLPDFPKGYTFEFTLDLTKSSTTEKHNGWDFPLNVKMVERPSDEFVGGTGWHADDIRYEADHNQKEVTVKLSDKDGNSRISLRDALRFDWNIHFDHSNPKNPEVSIEKIIVKGEMDEADLYYLGDLVEHGKITYIDLSDATVKGGLIPARFAGGENNEKLESIILPKNLGKIGAYAFAGCKALKTVTFQNDADAKVTIGKGAFKDCKTLDNSIIQDIIDYAYSALRESVFEGTDATDIKIPERITEIDKNAFANTPLKKLTLPWNCTGKEGEMKPYKTWVEGTNVGEIFVQDGNKDGLEQNAAREARTLTKDKTTLTIQAEDFNKGNGKGWFNKGDNGEAKGANKMNGTYRSDFAANNYSFGIGEENGKTKLGWSQEDYWFNYTFAVDTEKNGYYMVDAYISTGNGTAKPRFSIDGGENVELDVNGGGWWTCGKQTIGYVNLKSGIHYITYLCDTGVDLDKFEITKVDNLGTPVFTPGENAGEIITEYNFEEGTEIKPILSSHADAFAGVESNDCEVVFTDEKGNEMSADMIKGYRNEGEGKYNVNNAGIRKLLTKTMDSKKPYKVVYQKHADAVVTRPSMKEGWNSVVYPFDVTGKILSNAKAGDSKVFDRAATLYDNQLNNDEYDVKLRFKYLDNQNTFQNDGETIDNGTPFILYFSRVPENGVYTFEDVTTRAWDVNAGMGGYSEEQLVTYNKKVNGHDNTRWSFTGRLDYDSADPVFINDEIYWIVGSSYYHKAANSKMKMTNFVSWFEAYDPTGVSEIKAMLGFMEDDATGIKVVNSEASNGKNDNVYSLQGQIVRRGTTSVEGLPQGVYVVAGNRVVVK